MQQRTITQKNHFQPLIALAAVLVALPLTADAKDSEMAGYMGVDTDSAPPKYNAGFSFYVAAWPLLKQYPGHRFQTGLYGTWMFPKQVGEPPKGLYSDIEGGLGWWRDTRFPTETPKFIMGGVAPDFREIANGPSHGRGSWEDPKGLYGVAQLSPWLLFPIDGLNIKQGTNGDLFGYGYLTLPLTPAKTMTAGKNIPTGENSWTLFLNTGNFKGPVCFFTPYFWSRSVVANPALTGLLLDTRPADPNKPFSMETQYVPAVLATDAKGEEYARVAPMTFPANPNGHSVVMHRVTCYSKQALWDGVNAWFEGGAAVNGTIQSEGAHVLHFKAGNGSSWGIRPGDEPHDKRTPIDWASFARSSVPDPTTYCYQWDKQLTKQFGSAITLPEYYHRVKDGKKDQWVVAKAAEVPGELKARTFTRPQEEAPQPYDTPSDPKSPFKSPGPVAGPFKARLGDHSIVTYYWYRFADQPALLNADLTKEEREKMQVKIEKLHRTWTKERNYFAPPTVGKLADLDPAQIVTPPKGFEIGYVPIATRQELNASMPKW